VSAAKTVNPERISEINQFLLHTANKYNRTIGWTMRSLATFPSDYLHRLELIDDFISLTNSIKNLRNIPIASIESERVTLYEEQTDNAYNWIRLHEPLARLDEEHKRVRKEIEEELEKLSAMMDSVSEDINNLIRE